MSVDKSLILVALDLIDDAIDRTNHGIGRLHEDRPVSEIVAYCGTINVLCEARNHLAERLNAFD